SEGVAAAQPLRTALRGPATLTLVPPHPAATGEDDPAALVRLVAGAWRHGRAGLPVAVNPGMEHASQTAHPVVWQDGLLRGVLGGLLAFGALNAFAGGLYGMSGAPDVPREWLEGSPF